MRHIVAVDAGGSKCDVLLLCETGTVLGFGHKDFKDLPPGKCYLGAGRSPECTESAIADALGGLQSEEVHVVHNFRSFALSRECARHAGKVLYHHVYEYESIFAMLGRDAGIAALAGTGAFAYARNHDGEELFLDSLGPLLGDYGSGYYIGSLAIRAAAKSAWHPRHATSLACHVRKACTGEEDAVDKDPLMPYMLENPDRSEIAGLVPIVDREANAGDGAAISILRQAAEAYSETLYDVIDRLDMASQEYYMMCSGGVVTHSALYRQYLFERVKEFAPQVIPLVCSLPQVAGMALCMLRRLWGSDADAACEELVRSLAEYASSNNLRKEMDYGSGQVS